MYVHSVNKLLLCKFCITNTHSHTHTHTRSSYSYEDSLKNLHCILSARLFNFISVFYLVIFDWPGGSLHFAPLGMSFAIQFSQDGL